MAELIPQAVSFQEASNPGLSVHKPAHWRGQCICVPGQIVARWKDVRLQAVNNLPNRTPPKIRVVQPCHRYTQSLGRCRRAGASDAIMATDQQWTPWLSISTSMMEETRACPPARKTSGGEAAHSGSLYVEFPGKDDRNWRTCNSAGRNERLCPSTNAYRTKCSPPWGPSWRQCLSKLEFRHVTSFLRSS
jgi:hypothetical protein